MTTLYQCQKCKKLFDEIIDHDNRRRNLHSVNIDFDLGNYKPAELYDEFCHIDLCDECLQEVYALIGFVNEGKINREKRYKEKQALEQAIRKDSISFRKRWPF